MQWDSGKNLGFSAGHAEDLYLPVDPSPDAPTVAAQEREGDSMLNHVRSLLRLRGEEKDLGNYSSFEVYSAEEGSRLFAYKRGEYLVAVNPGAAVESAPLDGKYEIIFTMGEAAIAEGKLNLESQSFAVLKPIA